MNHEQLSPVPPAPAALPVVLTPGRRALLIAALTLVCAAMIAQAQLGEPRRATEPVLAVRVQYDGGLAEVVERRITRPLEDAVASVPHLVHLRSVSSRDEAELVLHFHSATDLDAAYLELRAAVARVAPGLPESARPPRILRSDRSSPVAMIIALPGGGTSDPEQLRNTLAQVDGVAEVIIAGRRAREAAVQVAPDRAAAAAVSMLDIITGLRGHAVVGGFARPGTPSATLDTRIKTIEQLPAIFIRPSLRLGDIAATLERSPPAEYVSRLNGSERVLLYLQPQGDVNSVTVSRRLRRVLQRYPETEIAVDRGKEIVSEITRSAVRLAAGLALAAAALGALARSGIAALLCLFGALGAAAGGVAGLAAAGLPLELLGLTGVAAASWVTIALVAARLRRADNAALGILVMLAALAAPTAFLAAPLRFTLQPLIVANAAGLLVGYAYVRVCLPGRAGAGLPARGRDTVSRPGFTLIALWVFAAASAGAHGLGSPFQKANHDSFSVLLEFPAGATLQSVERKSRRVEEALLRHVAVTTVASRYERERARFDLTAAAGHDSSALLADLRAMRTIVPGAYLVIPEHSRADLHATVTITGDSHAGLRERAEMFAQTLRLRSEVAEVVFAFKQPPASYIFRLDQDRLAHFDVSPATLTRNIAWSLGERVAAKWYTADDERDVRVFAAGGADLNARAFLQAPAPAVLANGARYRDLGAAAAGFEVSRLYRYDRRPGVQLTAFFNHTRAARPHNKLAEPAGLADLAALAAEAGRLTGYRHVVAEPHLGPDGGTATPMVLALFFALPCLIILAKARSAGEALRTVGLAASAVAGGVLAVQLTGSSSWVAAALGLASAIAVLANSRLSASEYFVLALAILPCALPPSTAGPLAPYALAVLAALAAAQVTAASTLGGSQGPA